ncbi:MAG TPA: serine/threonine-protein kinase [Vicinamibacteria bacterium]|nr:serine/threonine-protein kinase [Vicinamibacteria bacterium]
MPLNAERWREVLPHLDQALDLDEAGRREWLAGLRDEDAPLAAEVEGLLARRAALADEGFLERLLLPIPPASLAGLRLGAYTLRSPLGQGGMGSVWLAERTDGRFEGSAAVKLLNASMVGRDGEARFRREGSILARLRHPHIAHLIDAGVSPAGQPYLVLERVDGERIDRYCDARSLEIDARIRLFLDVLSAVRHAHANLVVHRDIKPSNVLVGSDGRVKLLDFGIAKLLQDESGMESTAHTREGEAALTPGYAAPEQLTGGDVTTATDVYSLGVLLYVLLTGRHPTGGEGDSPAERIRAALDTVPARASDAVSGERTAPGDWTTVTTAHEAAIRRATTPKRLRGKLQGDLDNIVAKALKKRPDERYASVDALTEDLRRYLAHEPVSARADSVAYRVSRFLRRHRLGAAAAFLLVASMAAGLGATAWQSARARREASRAQAVTEFLVGLFELSSSRRPQSEHVTARELLDQGVKRLDAELKDEPDLRGSLLGVMGRVHSSLGLYEPAARLLERSEALLRERRPADDAERARVLSELASVRSDQGEYARAADIARESLAVQRRVYGADHPDIAVTLDRLAVAIKDQGRPEEAEPLLREALAMRRRLYGNAHRDVVFSLAYIANMLYDRGDYAGAEATHREALTIARSLPGDSFPAVPWSMGNLAAVLSMRGHRKEAIGLLREALVLFRARLGEEHPDLAPSLRNLANALRAEGQLKEATELYQQTLAIERRAYGDTHHEVAKTTHDLATLLHEQGRLAEAEALHRECLAILQKSLPPNHPHLGRAMMGLARVRSDQGMHAEAEGLFRQALTILESGLGPRHDLTERARVGLAHEQAAQRHARLPARPPEGQVMASHRY